MQRTKILISPAWKNILKIRDTLWAHTNKSTAQQEKSRIFSSQETGALGNNVEEEPQKPRPILKKYICLIFTGNICSACNPMQAVVFCKHVLIV